MKTYWKQAAIFVVVGLILYGAVYCASEVLVYKYAKRNTFYKVKTADFPTYDYLILGASHALPFSFEDMNNRLEEMTGARITNLSTPGGGIVVNSLLLDYFLAGHNTKNVIYFLDSFALYSREWNEDRLKDVKLFQRAPFDLTLAKLLLYYSFNKDINRSVAIDYISGFSKINNHDRFSLDVLDDEREFNKVHRPSKRKDTWRINYLYPAEISEEIFNKYLSKFVDMISLLKSRDIDVIVIKTPIPKQFYEMIPHEQKFDERIKQVLAGKGVLFYDFSLVSNEKEYFYNSDHLNRTGVLNFFENHLKQVLITKEVLNPPPH